MAGFREALELAEHGLQPPQEWRPESQRRAPAVRAAVEAQAAPAVEDRPEEGAGAAGKRDRRLRSFGGRPDRPRLDFPFSKIPKALTPRVQCGAPWNPSELAHRAATMSRFTLVPVEPPAPAAQKGFEPKMTVEGLI